MLPQVGHENTCKHYQKCSRTSEFDSTKETIYCDDCGAILEVKAK